MFGKIVQLIFNYYLVIKACWAIVLFQVLGYFSLLVFDQGLDILRGLGFANSPLVTRHTVFVWIAISWWGWQSWRSSRMILHFTHFNFWGYQPGYALRAQVLVPRILGIVPYLMLSGGIIKAKGYMPPFVILLLSSAIWMLIFVHFRKELIVWSRTLKVKTHALIPDYVPIKNGAYPAHFIWTKQKKWIAFRILVMVFFFFLFIINPIGSAQFIGSAGVVLFGFGTWLIAASLVNMFEKRIRFPLSFTILVLVIVFSWFNDNHELRDLSLKAEKRPSLEHKFQHWMQSHKQADTTHVVIVAAEGGGIRSAYWTSGILSQLKEEYPIFGEQIFAISAVSGGALGSVLYNSLDQIEAQNIQQKAKRMMADDFLAPVTASLIFPDLLQKFLPWPVKKFDRARVLEKSWETSWSQVSGENDYGWDDGFLQTFNKGESNAIFLNSTHVESGYRTVISNVDLTEMGSDNIIDFFQVHPNDIRISTAIGLSARFPLLTPPAQVKTPSGEIWGHLVDGGYHENVGATTMIDTYLRLRKYCDLEGLPVKFHMIAIRNTLRTKDFTPMKGLTEVLPPLITFSHIWSHNGEEALRRGRALVEQYSDDITEIQLVRDDKENIPLGWYLSASARQSIDVQLAPAISQLKPKLDAWFHQYP
jgi:hypothetical protein